MIRSVYYKYQKESHLKKPKFKIGDTVRYYLLKGQFAKESNLNGSWSKTVYKIHRINKAHKFNPMHSYVLAELGKNTPVKGLPTDSTELAKTRSSQ